MIAYLWPIALVVVSNIVYQICAKSVPSGIHPLASLTATYLVGALVSGVLYYLLSGDPNLLREYGKLNWASVVLGLVIVGLEAGWQVSTGYIVQSAVLAVGLLLVGYLMYHEALTWNKITGVLVCLAGLILINYR